MKYHTLYEVTGDIKDINVMLVPLKDLRALEKQISDDGWRLNPDRMGGCYTEDEKRTDTWK